MKITTQIQINAPAQKVWEILMGFETYPQWNPFVKSLEGDIREGGRIEIKLPGMTFKPIIQVIRPNKEFRWLGHLWIKGLFDGEHCFQLEQLADGKTRFIHSEYFSGILVPFFRKQLLAKTKFGFEAMNKSLKNRVETTVNM
ncbi:SRPBCC domain-containing protein [Echinicola salinicaeni]|uniref:SRPBCC domain-containing protein n=1 Tax=Echinicola salinicaeni TaxID=2762757 RepID=UPI001644A90D|nr:SRPBCC domain-containing protein [Echinicola salinicaeni]